MARAKGIAFSSFAIFLSLAGTSAAQSPTPPIAPEAAPDRNTAAEAQTQSDSGGQATGSTVPPPSPFTFGGYAEVFYQWNFNQPANEISNFRGFDNRHNTFTLSNIALDAQWDYKDVTGRVTLQVGHTPSTYYLSEPTAAGASGANASNAELWKYIQQAYAGYRFGLGEGLSLVAGVFLSPIGPESMAVRDNWNWSRSNLFFGLPFYHTGVRATYAISSEWAVSLAAWNGWNSVVDNNHEKSVMAQLTYTRSELALSVLYFGGVERPERAPEKRAWRHLFDAHATWNVTSWFALLAHTNAGFEPNHFGVSSWAAGALYARVRALSWLYVAIRADAFHERTSSDATGSAAPIFWPSRWVSSGTVTTEFKPRERVSFRLEYRHDHAGSRMYFGGRIAGDGSIATPYIPNRKAQNTVTLGATAWF